jgi:predicted ABC-type transport system involved in lysophospholipase L1 biosynthesis ATPase subunit
LTSVLATHNRDLARRANRILRLANGRLTETVVPMVP